MLEKPKVLVIGGYDGHQIHGMRPEAEILVGLAQNGFDISLMTNGDSIYISRFEENGVRIIPMFPRSKYNRSDISAIREELLRNNYDILYLLTDNRAITAGLIAARKVAVKVVLYRGYCGNLAWYDPTSYTKHLHPRVDKIICNGSAIQDYFHSQLFFDKSKTEVFIKGHSVDWYKDVVKSDLTTYGIDKSAFVATWVGTNRRRMKGLSYMLEATYFWPEEYNMHLVLVGGNTETKENLALARKSPNRDRIHFLGVMSEPHGIVLASDVVVLASVKGEAATRFVQESMSLGIAPVITNIPGNKELVVHGESGLVVPIRDSKALSTAILKLKEDPVLLKSMRFAAKERIRTVLSHENTVQKTCELFEKLARS